MRLAHLADLHLGKTFHGFSLIEDQRQALEAAVGIVRDADVDAVLIAGDLYDRALPGREAVRLLDDFLRELVLGAGVPVIAIAGNHDSGDHLGFGAWLFASGDVHLRGRIERDPKPVTLEDRYGTVAFYAFPYVEPEAARETLAMDPADSEPYGLTHCDVVGLMSKRALAHRDAHSIRRAVVIAHAFVQGSTAAEECRRSERGLYLGGAGAVPASVFEGFQYVALGHLHRPQGAGPVGRYPGSLLKYSFDEAEHSKGLTLAELDAEGGLRVEHRPIAPRRDLRVLRGSLADLLEDPSLSSSEGCFVCAELTDKMPPPQAMERLRRRFPNAAELRFAREIAPPPSAPFDLQSSVRDPEGAFVEFFTLHSPGAPTEGERAVFREALGASPEP